MALIGGSPAARVVDSVTTPDLISALRCMWSSFFFFFWLQLIICRHPTTWWTCAALPLIIFRWELCFVRNPPVFRTVAVLRLVGQLWRLLFGLFALNTICDTLTGWSCSGWLTACDNLWQGYLHVHRRKTNGTDYFRLTAISSPTCQQSRRLERATFY